MKKIVTSILSIFMMLSIVGCTTNNSSSSVEQEQTCEHLMTRVERIQPTCIEEGFRAHYECEKCNKYFFDENGKVELSIENITIERLKHSLSHYEATEKVVEYWHCFACDKYFIDAEATQETTYHSLYENAFDPIRLNDISSGNVYLSTLAGGELNPLDGDFTYRAFMSWKNDENNSLDAFPASKRVQVNINFNDETTLPGSSVSAQWYNCGIGYSKELGLYYKNFQADDKVPVSQKLTQLFLEQNGIYVIAVREGSGISLYLEDKEGNPHRISSGTFGKDRTIVRLAVNIAEGVDGWTPSSTNTAICIGVGNPKCVFDKVLSDSGK